MTLDRIVRRNALRYPDKAALVLDASSCTWRELDGRVDRVANALHARGLARGERVAVLLGNCAEFVELYFGLARAGVIAVPVNYRLTPGELAQLLRHATPSLFVVGAAFADKASDVAGLLPELTTRRWIVGDAALPGAEAYADVVAGASPAAVAESGDEEDIFAIFYTSGTTGLPKGAMVSHRNLVANAFNQFVADGSRHDDVNLVATPLYHMGAVFMAVTYMMLGCTQVILPSFDPARWLDAVGRRRASVALLVPTMINAILENPLLADADLSSLRRVFYGGGPMPPTVLRRALEQLRCGFTQGYGLTETLEATFLVAADHVVDGDEKQRKRLASAGREAVDAEVRIVDGHGRDCATGEVGEVLVRSASVIRGYWNVAEETGKAIRDGWFHTGDLGYLDEDRYLFVVDRVKDMVISGGVNIYSKEVESVLYEHPAVLEAAVIGLPDEAWGEAVSAAVVLRPGMSASADELIAHCKASLAGYKKPRHVAFLDELPKNPSGKILKRELRRLLAVPGEVA
ncbi:MAG: long-chain-fatty-acid--CoA ligase [Aromatoleum sp.]|jgi:acyl-CoA synthetase (AMP-forming)/AMP-acid ligase II|uniref:long-chain-fatty-acid--CoA ligase n=1 Tax=Aromatoleum sp. TaxID=2307007 RepID=UPI002895D66B|nr:long-chain-fatty-acid--CoA ligase [Aromatoleum sp.]MDT3669462.1 long-chain-fatty-acid--CoA ligase [Aromatoleum sp.]